MELARAGHLAHQHWDPPHQGQMVLGVVREEEGAAQDILWGLLEWSGCRQERLWGPVPFIRGSSWAAKEGSLQNLLHAFRADCWLGVGGGPRVLPVAGNREGSDTGAKTLSIAFPSSPSCGARGSSGITLSCSLPPTPCLDVGKLGGKSSLPRPAVHPEGSCSLVILVEV